MRQNKAIIFWHCQTRVIVILPSKSKEIVHNQEVTKEQTKWGVAIKVL
jgi:hypothetical protein